jgi:predicted PurR-regulated permease PerM
MKSSDFKRGNKVGKQADSSGTQKAANGGQKADAASRRSGSSSKLLPESERKQGSPFSRYASTDSSGQSQRFIKNSRYFTICIYGLVMILIAAIIFKAVIDIEKTKAMFGNIFNVLSPFIFGALLAYILNPMVHLFYKLLSKLSEKTRISLNHTVHTILAILFTYLLVFGFIVLVLLYVIPELINNILDFANYVPQAYASLLELLNRLQERFPNVDITGLTKPLTDALPDMVTTLRNMATNLVPAIYSVSMSVASWIVNLLITIMVSIYMLYDKRQLMHACWKVIYAFLPEKYIPVCHEILAECNRLFSSFVIGKFIDSSIIGVLCFLLMSIMKLEYALLISLIVGVTNMIPYFGPFIGAIPGILILLFVKPIHALAFAILILCLQQFDGLILGPKILGNSTGMKPLWIIFAITIGGSVGGLVGMFLGVPVVAILIYLFDSYLQYRLDKKEISESRVDEVLQDMELDD